MRSAFRLITISFCFSLIQSPNLVLGQGVQYRGPSNWVQPVEVSYEAQPAPENSGSLYYLLLDQQENIALKESYEHYAYRVLNAEGVQGFSDISIDFDPSYQSLTVHNISIIRNGETLDRNQKNKAKVIQREQNADRFMYDGMYTAIFNLPDVRAGDIVEYSFTKRGDNPVFGGHIGRVYYLNYSLPIERIFTRILVPEERNLQLRNTNTSIRPSIKTVAGLREYIWEDEKIPPLLTDQNYPSWYDPYARVEASDFDNWSAVVSWGNSHFKISDSEIKAINKITEEKWSAITNTEEFILATTRFVQDEIRYLGFEMGLNSHKPHSPIDVYEQRFGDCKDKSLLLVSLLRTRGIDAFPMLVNSSLKGEIQSRLPMIGAFNHCVVVLERNGTRNYIDPTINYQGGSLSDLYFPNYQVGLILREGENMLASFPLVNRGEIVEDHFFELKEVNGILNWNIRTAFKGIEADIQRSKINSSSLESLQNSYLSYYGNLYSDVEVAKPISIEDDRELNILVVKEYYTVPEIWKPNAEIEGQVYAEFYPLSMETYFNVEKYSQRKTPYPLSYPLRHRHTMQITLPEAWTIEPDQRIINSDYYTYEYKVAYNRNNRIATISHSYETLSDHVPVKDASKMIEDHKKMMGDLSYYFTYSNTDTSGFKLSGIMVVAGMGILLLAGFGAYYVFMNYDPEPENPIYPGEKINGWLVLVAIGVIVTPIRVLVQIIQTDSFFNDNVWGNMMSQGTGFSAFLLFEFVYNITYFAFSIMVVVLFFQRRSSLPTIITIGYIVTFVMLVVDEFIANQMAIGSPEPVAWKDITRALITVVIWVPYFHYSERVKNTFVIRRSNNDRSTTYSLHR